MNQDPNQKPIAPQQPAPAALAYSPAQPRGLMWKLGLHRPELRAWAMYDWANSAFITTIITAVFPIYFSKVANAGAEKGVATFRLSAATTLGMVFIAVLSPFLGAVADFRPIKKPLIGFFLAIGVVTTALMYFIHQGDWVLAAVLFFISNIAVNGSFVFYDSLLPHIAREDEVDRVSSAGYALGYVGGGILLAINLLWSVKPHWFGMPDSAFAARMSFVSVAVWWLVFSIPLFRRVPEPEVRIVTPPGMSPGSAAIRPGERPSAMSVAQVSRAAFDQLMQSFRDLKGYRHAFLMLLAFLIYNDGIGTIFRMAAIYGDEAGINESTMMAAILLTQFVGIPFAFLFGAVAGRIGSKQSIFIGLAAYVLISILGYYMHTDRQFLLLAIGVGMVQGGTQALSRSLFSSLIPRHQSGQFFGFFAVVEKFAGILGPLTFVIVKLMGGTSRTAILSLVVFFAVGAVLLWFVNVEEGQQIARKAEAAARPTEGATST